MKYLFVLTFCFFLFSNCKSLKVVDSAALKMERIYLHEGSPFTGVAADSLRRMDSYYLKGVLYRQNFYFQDGGIADVCLWKNGTPLWWKTYYKSGLLKQYADNRSNTIKVYYETSNLYSEGEFKFAPSYPVGEWIYYFENGKISAKRHFKNGDLDGETIYYYENGNIREESYYVDGYREGECIHYYESGQVMERACYDGGGLRGDRKTYYENGNIYEEAFHDHQGVYHGEYRKYYQNGGIWKLLNFNHGSQVGNSVIYNENGEIISN